MIDNDKEITVSLLLYCFRNLIRHCRRRRVSSRRIAKDKGVIEFGFGDEIFCLLVILFDLTWEPNDDIGGQGDARSSRAEPMNQFHVLFRRVSPMHRL
jgi:hypothetical protein